MKKKITKKDVKVDTNNDQTLVLRDQLARVLADYDNLRKRVDIDKKNFEKLANLRLVMKLLPVLDVLKQAQNHLKDQGVAVTIKEFEDALKQEGIEEIKVEVGSEFNPELMEVIEVMPGIEDNKVAEILASGYKFIDGPVIRHTRVKVFSKGN
jgi:molecular chaperone GrpE